MSRTAVIGSPLRQVRRSILAGGAFVDRKIRRDTWSALQAVMMLGLGRAQADRRCSAA